MPCRFNVISQGEPAELLVLSAGRTFKAFQVCPACMLCAGSKHYCCVLCMQKDNVAQSDTEQRGWRPLSEAVCVLA